MTKEEKIKYKKKWRLKNKDKLKVYHKEYGKIYFKDNKELHAENMRLYRVKNKEALSLKRIAYIAKNRDKINEQCRIWRSNNKEYTYKYYKENKKHIHASMNERSKKRAKNDYLYKIKIRIRSLIGTKMKKFGYKKHSRTYSIPGIDYIGFKKYIENKFTKGMLWENSGKWHYDHVIPLVSAKTEDEIIKLNHYTNFQPLWAIDNLKKNKW